MGKDKTEKVVDKILEEEMIVTKTNDGWLLSFSESVLKELLEQSGKSPNKKVVLFVLDKDKVN